MLVKIDDRVKVVLSEGGFMYCNCVWIDDDVQAVIDSGADLPSLRQAHPADVDILINTHHHYDHVRGNYLFDRAQVFIHELDLIPMTDEIQMVHYNSLDRWPELMTGYDNYEAARLLGIEAAEIQRNMYADESFKDGRVFDFGSTRVEVIHTPGHSAGHCSFWFPEQDLLFSGDICLTKAGPWYGETYADPDQMINSINRLIKLQPAKIISSHISDFCTDVIPRLEEYRNRIFAREERVYDFLKQQPSDLDTIADHKLIYALHPTPFVLFWEKLMLIKHLQRLENKGLIGKTEQGFYYAR